MPNASATKTRSYHHGDLRNALVREASQLVEQEGAAKLSLRGLARRLGVSPAAPAHHFAGRDELLMEIAAEGFADLADALEQALEGDDVEVQAGLAYLEVALGHPERFRLMFGSRPRAEVESPERLRLESRRAYSALLRVARGKEGPIEIRTSRRNQCRRRSWRPGRSFMEQPRSTSTARFRPSTASRLSVHSSPRC